MYEEFPEIVTAKDLARMLNVCYTTIMEKIIKENQIPYRRIGKTYRFRKEDVIKFAKGE